MQTRSQVSKDKRITRSMKRAGSQVSKHKRITQSGSRASKHKSRKLNGKNSTSSRQEEKSLNDFHDAILCHILSFLPTELALRTSVLSKRWRYLWTSLPNLDFKERTHLYYRADVDRKTEQKKFIDFVERVLCRDNAPRIKKFALSCNVIRKVDVSRINRWISKAVSRNALEFDTCHRQMYVSDISLEFPHCLFNSETLEVLKIEADYELRLPPQVSLPNLKKLTLRCICFRDYREVNLLFASYTLEELVIGSILMYSELPGQLIIPAPKLLHLKNMTLKRIALSDYHALNLVFASSALEELVLDGCAWEGLASAGHLIISARNLQSLTMNDLACSYDGLASVTISSPLRIFHYSGPLIKDYRLSCSSYESLEKATFLFNGDTDYDVDERICLDRFHNILRSLRSVKYLNLSAYATMELSRARLPIFNNLTSLEIFDDAEEEFFFGGPETILKKCPYLETLKLPGDSLMACNSNCLFNREKLKCLSSLKNITIGSFKGNTEELVSVHILLAKATSLETMEIDLAMDASERKRIQSFLSIMPRGSKSCKLNFRSS